MATCQPTRIPAAQTPAPPRPPSGPPPGPPPCCALLMAERPRFFTPAEVASHNSAADLWVSFLGKVFHLGPLVTRHQGDPLLLPILECAGSDISHWFDAETGDPQTCVDPVSGCVRFSTPRGRFLHVPPAGPRSDWASDGGEPWWRDRSFQVGLLTAKTRWLRIVNTVTSQEQLLQVCSEETLEEILRRYLRYNSHAHSYTWMHRQVVLQMERTLQENGLEDQDQELQELRLDPAQYIPTLLLMFNDDLTEA